MERALQLREQIGRRLDPFGNVGIPEDMRLLRVARLPAEFKGFEAAGFRETIINGRQRDGLQLFQPLSPEAAERDVIK